LVLDCGTGLANLGRELVMEHQTRIGIVLSHYHMDHLFGFPYFDPFYAPNFQVNLMGPGYNGLDVQNKLGRYLNGVYHPVRLQDITANMDFSHIKARQKSEVNGFVVEAFSLNHPGGSMGYRIERDGRVVVYMTDTAPFASPHTGVAANKPPTNAEKTVLKLLQGADLLIVDAMFTWEEYLTKMTWGHNYAEYGVALAKQAGVSQVALFHHAPLATDAILDGRASLWAQETETAVWMAKEGQVMDLEG